MLWVGGGEVDLVYKNSLEIVCQAVRVERLLNPSTQLCFRLQTYYLVKNSGFLVLLLSTYLKTLLNRLSNRSFLGDQLGRIYNSYEVE